MSKKHRKKGSDSHVFGFAPFDNFCKKHKNGYRIIVGCGGASLIAPMVLLLVFTQIVCPMPDSAFQIPALVGALILGIGLINLLLGYRNKHYYFAVSGGCFPVGALLMAASLAVLYIPELYSMLAGETADCYFMNLVFLALPPINYSLFRVSVASWLERRRIRKIDVRQRMKGARNYWWYEEVHKAYGLGKLYFLNKSAVIIYTVTLGLSLLFGWVKPATPIISLLYAALSVIISAMSIFSSVQSNLECHGRPVVLFARYGPSKRCDSIILDICEVIFCLLSGYAHIKYMLGLFM